jgi:magnesium transporter
MAQRAPAVEHLPAWSASMTIVSSEIFLSTVLGKLVINQQGHEIGKLLDLVMIAGDRFPEVSHLLVQHAGRTLCVPGQRVTLFNRFVISISGSLPSIPEYRPREVDILLKRDVLDRQIVDVNGAKVVRVNDLKLGNFQNRLCVFFVDVGFRGLTRRIGCERLAEKIAAFFNRPLPHTHISWRYVQLLEMNLSRLTLTVARDQLKELHPADLAQIIASIPSGNVQTVLASLDRETAAEAIHELEPELRSRVISQLDSEQASRILEEMDPDQAADVLGDLPKEKAQELLGLMDEKEADEIEELLEHEEDTAGGLMNSRFISIAETLSAEEALQLVRKLAEDTETIYYLYVVDSRQHLQGVVSLKDLLTNPPQAKIADFMTSGVKSVRVDATPYEVLEVVAKYNFVAVPVLDMDDRMAGIVTVDDVLELFIPSTLRRKRHRG